MVGGDLGWRPIPCCCVVLCDSRQSLTVSEPPPWDWRASQEDWHDQEEVGSCVARSHPPAMLGPPTCQALGLLRGPPRGLMGEDVGPSSVVGCPFGLMDTKRAPGPAHGRGLNSPASAITTCRLDVAVWP